MRAALAAAVLLAWVGSARAGGPAFPDFPDPSLKQGRAVWIANCRVCHDSDLAGAPRITDRSAWAPRLKKSREALYRSALGGLVGSKGTEMPARGGNAKLTDAEVRSAVDYMVTVVTH